MARLFSKFMTHGVPLIVRDCLEGGRAVDWSPTGVKDAMMKFHSKVRKQQGMEPEVSPHLAQ